MSQNVVSIEKLNRENYSTWKVLIESLLIRDDLWEYVSGKCKEPEDTKLLNTWKKQDAKAKASILLNICPSLLKEVKDLIHSKDVWDKLKEIFDSKTPARKAALFKKLILEKASSDNVPNHVSEFSDVVDKLKSIDVTIDDELLSILLLYSLPSEYENFRIAIETRDSLPSLNILKIKIIEEHNARSNPSALSNPSSSSALNVKNKSKNNDQRNANSNKKRYSRGKITCFSCRKIGYKAAECRSNKQIASVLNSCENLLQTIYTGDCSSENTKWILDSGATSHMSNTRDIFIDFEKMEFKLNLADKSTTEIKGRGKVKLSGTNNIILENVLYVPKLRLNLLSASKITDHGCKIKFYTNKAIVVNEQNKVILQAIKKEGLYEVVGTEIHKANVALTGNDLHLWHQRYGHLNFNTLKNMINYGKVRGISIKNLKSLNPVCEICVQGKQTALPFKSKSSITRSKNLLELIHSDICGAIRTESAGGAKYFITFIDDSSKWTEVYFLKGKNEALQAFKNYKAKVENLMDCKIKHLRTDNGKEYVNHEFSKFLEISGIQHQLTAEYTPQQNGMAERHNRTLIEMARCMLLQSRLPVKLWADAVNTANYIRNRSASSSLQGETPYKLWKKREPQVSYFRVFGTLTYVLQKGPGRKKFEARSKPYYLIGYMENAKAYKLYDKQTGKVIKSRDVRFINEVDLSTGGKVNEGNVSNNEIILLKNEIACEPASEADNNEPTQGENWKPKDKDEESEEDGYETPMDDDETSKDPKRTRGRPRIIRTGLRGRPKKVFNEIKDTQNEEKSDTIIENADTEKESESCDSFDEDGSFHGFLASNYDPVCDSEIHAGENIEDWKTAMRSELDAHKKNNTWTIVDKPKDSKVIGCKWVFNTKSNAEDGIIRKKARLVAKGCAQQYGVDYYETYAPVARQRSIRIIVALAVKRNLYMHQLDISTAYLHGHLKETVYMKIPEYYDKINKIDCKNKVCKLNRAIYGLKQSGRIWYQRLDDFLLSINFQRLKNEPCMYIYDRNEKWIIVTIYVDDIIIASQSTNDINWFNEKISKEFETRNIGKIKNFLGIEFNLLNDDKILLTQGKFINKLLKKFEMQDCNSVSTPMETNLKLSKDMCPKNEKEKSEMKNVPYQQLIGSLLYLATTTRPDISFVTSVLSQFNNDFGRQHWLAAKRVLRYLKQTINFGLFFRKVNDDVVGYADADWGSNIDDRKSYTGFFFTMSSGPISWEVRKQKTVALSSAEAEFMSLTDATKEAIYLNSLLSEIKVRANKQIIIYNDNKGAQLIAMNPVVNNRSKHIDIRYNFIRDVIKQNLIQLKYLNTQSMPADILTKSLPSAKFSKCLEGLSLKSFKDNEN